MSASVSFVAAMREGNKGTDRKVSSHGRICKLNRWATGM